MRRAGYDVRVLPEEDLGWEENPPTLMEFLRRDLRWCQGNMQYWRFLVMPRLKPVSRYQLVLAILMFIGSPAWIGLLGLATIALVMRGPATSCEPTPGVRWRGAHHVVRAEDRGDARHLGGAGSVMHLAARAA